MASNDINIVVNNNPISAPNPQNGVMMLFAQATAIGSTFALNTNYLLTQLSDATALGITLANDLTNGIALYKAIYEFYQEGPAGTPLWVVGVDKTANGGNNFSTYVNVNTGTTFQHLIQLTSATDPTKKARIIGFVYERPQTKNTTTDFLADVPLTQTALKATQAQMFQSGYQWSFIIDGNNMKATATPSNLATRATDAIPTGSICITGQEPDGVSNVGGALGRAAKISIGHGFGCVEDGAIAATQSYLTNGVTPILLAATATLVVGDVYQVMAGSITYNGTVYQPLSQFTCVTGHTTFTSTGGGYVTDTSVDDTAYNAATDATLLTKGFSGSDITLLGDKQFLFMRRETDQFTGLFWNDGATCDLAIDPLSSQEFNRVANYLADCALNFITGLKGKSDIPIDTITGLVDSTFLGTTEQAFYTKYINPLKIKGGTGDLNDAALVLSGTPTGTQIKWSFTLKIVPAFIAGGGTGVIQFSTTL